VIIRVAVIKDDHTIAADAVADPQHGDLIAAVDRVCSEARKVLNGPLWDCQIDIRHVHGYEDASSTRR
jgi:hypothetical protein